MGQFDFFVVNVASPSIKADLGASDGQIELVIGAYAVTFAAGLVTGGRLGDLFGRSRIFIIGLVAFSLTSLLCGIAPNPVLLIAARALQGLAGAILLPQVLAFINTEVEPQHRGTATGWFAIAGGIGSLTGQGLGGLLVQASPFGLGWRTIFFINLPVMLIAIPASWYHIPQRAGNSNEGLDLPGAGGLFFGMGAAVVAVTLFQSRSMTPGIVAAVVAAVLLAVTMAWEGRLSRDGKSATMDPSLFRVTSLRVGGLASGVFMGFFASYMFVLSVVLQGYSKLGPGEAGLIFVPSSLMFMNSSVWASRRNWPIRPRILVGCTITAAGLLIALVASVTTQSPSVFPWWMIAGVIGTGAGNGLVLPSILTISMRDVVAQQAGMASGTVTTLQQFAAALGVAVFGALAFTLSTPTAPLRGAAITFAIDVVLMGVVGLLVGVGLRQQKQPA